MVTLTYASITARKSLRYFIYFIIFLIIGRVFINTMITIYKKIFPPPPEVATVAFGKLPKLPFPQTEKVTLSFSQETVSGELPQFDPLTKVYFMPKKTANLLSLDYTKEKAQKMGFDPNSEQISDSIFRFKNKNSLSILETNIITGAFSISYDLNADPSPITIKPNQPEISISSIKNFLENAQLLENDLTGEAKFRYLKILSGGFVPAISLSDANVIRVDLFRKNYNNLPIVTNTPNSSNIWFIVSGLREKGKDILAGEYRYYPVDESKSSTYPIKTSQEAWQELNSGNFYMASRGNVSESEQIKIRKIYLAYYDPGVYVEFFQPVYVFEGDKNFVAYIPAVSNDYYGN